MSEETVKLRDIKIPRSEWGWGIGALSCATAGFVALSPSTWWTWPISLIMFAGAIYLAHTGVQIQKNFQMVPTNVFCELKEALKAACSAGISRNEKGIIENVEKAVDIIEEIGANDAAIPEKTEPEDSEGQDSE